MIFRRSGLYFNGMMVFALMTYAVTIPMLYRAPRAPVSAEMQVALPRFIQVFLAAGDRYLAANLASFRALVASTERMTSENYRVLGVVQSDVSWFNPAHEDNYYLASAILPWNGQVPAAQYVLRRAADARQFDWQPSFYYAFNELHFNKNRAAAVAWMRRTAMQTSDEMEQLQFQQLAADWAERGEDLGMAARLYRAMAKETRHKPFAKYLEKRAVRLDNLDRLQKAAVRYRDEKGRQPSAIDDLLNDQLITDVPVDPFGMVYVIDQNGIPQVAHMQNGSLPRKGNAR